MTLRIISILLFTVCLCGCNTNRGDWTRGGVEYYDDGVHRGVVWVRNGELWIDDYNMESGERCRRRVMTRDELSQSLALPKQWALYERQRCEEQYRMYRQRIRNH